MKYNYVYFNMEDSNTIHKNPKGYYSICTRDLENREDVQLVSYPLDYANAFVRTLFQLHHSRKINKCINLPFKSIWYKYYFKNKFSKDKPICFVVEGTYIDSRFIKYCKKKYEGCKFVFLFRDLIKYVTDSKGFSLDEMKTNYDLILSIDKKEAQQYNFVFFHEFESKINIDMNDDYEYDVYFAGKSKGRLDTLIRVYDHLSAGGAKCYFYITGVNEKDRVERKGIIYSSQRIPYEDMLTESLKARCLLDLNQPGAIGFTSRFLEGIMYNRKIITNNPASLNSKFYNTDYISYFSSPELIPISFLFDQKRVDFEYNEEFSPIHVLELIDAHL